MTYQLKKRIWTDADFEIMGWHDCSIYKMRLTEDLEMDIDYIFKWNKPDLEGLPFTFWIAPATLVFKNIHNLRFDFVTALDDSFEIEDVQRKNKNQWTILTREGTMQYNSDGYEQFIRQEPSFQFQQRIPYIERNGLSLDRITNQENTGEARKEILEHRQRNLDHYEKVKKRHLKRQQLEHLIKSRQKNEIDTKEFLLEKRELKELLLSYDILLKGTLFEDW